jgi:hypothetical protein
MFDDWDIYARTLGYNNEKEMLTDFYTSQSLSISEIASRINVGHFTVKRHLEDLNIPLRTRGGNNASNSQSKKMFHLDQRVVLSNFYNSLAPNIKVSPSMLYKYQRSITGGESHGVLYFIPDRRLGEIQRVIDASFDFTTNP